MEPVSHHDPIWQELVVREGDAGDRLDRVVALRTGVTRSQIRRLFDAERIRVDDRPAVARQKVRAGQTVRYRLPDPEVENLRSEAIPLEILFEDADLIVVDKPPGRVVYPAAGHRSGTLLNGLRFHCKRLASIGAPLRPGVVHRLDKDTSGVMVVAKSDDAYYGLQRQFRDRTIGRRYLAIVSGAPREEEGRIEAAIGRSDRDRKRMSTRTRQGKAAVTEWRLLERLAAAAVLSVRLRTGRTHQIRVHFSAAGHPVLGDRVYGRKTRVGSIRVPRQMLHAEELRFVHPRSGETHRYQAPMPADMADVLRQLRGQG